MGAIVLNYYCCNTVVYTLLRLQYGRPRHSIRVELYSSTRIPTGFSSTAIRTWYSRGYKVQPTNVFLVRRDYWELQQYTEYDDKEEASHMFHVTYISIVFFRWHVSRFVLTIGKFQSLLFTKVFPKWTNKKRGRRCSGTVEVLPRNFVFPGQCSISGRRPTEQGCFLSMYTAMGLRSCHREQTVEGVCSATQTARDCRLLTAVALGDKARHLHLW